VLGIALALGASVNERLGVGQSASVPATLSGVALPVVH
jgi:hypothetical protein